MSNTGHGYFSQKCIFQIYKKRLSIFFFKLSGVFVLMGQYGICTAELSVSGKLSPQL